MSHGRLSNRGACPVPDEYSEVACPPGSAIRLSRDSGQTHSHEESTDARESCRRGTELGCLRRPDWGAEKHFYCLRAAGEQPCESGELEKTPEAIEAWLRKLEKHFGHGPIAVAVEQSRGALVDMLSARPNLVIYTMS